MKVRGCIVLMLWRLGLMDSYRGASFICDHWDSHGKDMGSTRWRRVWRNLYWMSGSRGYVGTAMRDWDGIILTALLLLYFCHT